MNKNTDTDKQFHNRINPNLALYWLLPLLGLGIPIIIYVFTFAPILTKEMADEISFARFLYSSGSHTFAEGWNSTREFFPLSIRFFMSFFANSSSEWGDVLYKSALCSYSVFSAAFIFFVTSLRSQRLMTYVITAISALILGYYSIIATYDCNNFITYISFVLLLVGFIIHGIRMEKALPIRISVASLSVVILAVTLFYIGSTSKTYTFTTLSYKTIGKLFTSPLNPSSKLTAADSTLSNVSSYLTSHNIKNIYSTSDNTNVLSLTTNSRVNAIYANNLSTLLPSTDTDRALNITNESTANGIIESGISPTYVLVDNSDINAYTEYLTYSTSIYTDEFCTVYSFADSRILTDFSVRSDFKSISSSSYDTIILSMYDISTIDVNELYRTQLWNCYLATNVLSDISLLSSYNEQIFANPLGRYVLYIDPYRIFASTNNDFELYKEFIQASFSEAITNNPSVDFKFILPSYYIHYYEAYTDNDLNDMLLAYETFIDIADNHPNSSLNYFGYQEYLYANSHLYMEGSYSAYIPDIANTLLRETLTDNLHVKEADVCKSYVNNFIDQIRNYPFESESVYNLSDTNIVILGDSIFGNYTDATAIQSIIADYSGANVICRALGGACAANVESVANLSLEHQLNISEIESSISLNSLADANNVFILEFGLNDYFNGVAIDNYNSHNTESFSGALRTAIETINTNWPNSEIILLTPGHVLIQDYGTIPFNNGTVLEDYRKAVISLSQEYDCRYINLCEIGIAKEDCGEYLYGDLVHYNGRGRYVIAQYLLKYLTDTQ